MLVWLWCPASPANRKAWPLGSSPPGQRLINQPNTISLKGIEDLFSPSFVSKYEASIDLSFSFFIKLNKKIKNKVCIAMNMFKNVYHYPMLMS